MSYEKPSMVGKFNQYKASPANKLSVDLLRKAEGSVPLFIPINIGFNAVHSNILKNINIKNAILCKTIETGSISPGKSLSLKKFAPSTITPSRIGLNRTLYTLSEATPSRLLTSSCSKTAGAPDATSVLFDEKLHNVNIASSGALIGPTIINLENVGAVNYTSNNNYFDIAALFTMQATFLSSGTPTQDVFTYYTKSGSVLGRVFNDCIFRVSTSGVNVISFGNTFKEKHNNTLRLCNITSNTRFNVKAVAPQVVSPDMGKYKYSHVQRLSGRQMFVLDISEQTTYNLISSGFASATEYLVYSTSEISIYMSNSEVAVDLDGIKHFAALSSSDAYDNLIEVKEVTNTPDYKSYLLITKTTSIYIAVRREYTFSGGHLLSSPSDWHLVVVEENTQLTPATVTEGYTEIRARESSDICSFGELTSLSKILLGTKDLMLMSSSLEITHRYGAQDFKVIAGGWFDQALVLSQAQGICFSLSNTMVIPNPFLSEFYGQQEGINHTKDNTSTNNDEPASLTWTTLLNGRGGGTEWYSHQSLSASDAKNSSIVLFETLSIDSNGGFHSLPRAINEIAGYNPMSTFINWSANFFSIGEDDFVSSGKTLYKASGLGKLMPNPNDVVISGYNLYRSVRSYIVASKKGVADIYSYDKNRGIILVATIEGDLCCTPEMYNNVMFVPTETNDMFNIYRLDKNGVSLIYTSKISYSRSSCIFTREEGILIFYQVTDFGSIIYSISDNSVSVERNQYKSAGSFVSTTINGTQKVLYKEETTNFLYEIDSSNATSFIIDSQYIDLTKTGNTFVLTGIVIQTESLDSSSEYTCTVKSDGQTIANITNTFSTKEERINRHLTGLIPINGLSYSFTGIRIKLNNIKAEGYYQEV